MGCAKSKLPCRESARGDEKLKEILTQKGLVYSPKDQQQQQQYQQQQQPANYVYANGYNPPPPPPSAAYQQYYIASGNQECTSAPYHYQDNPHYYVYRHDQQQPNGTAANRSTGVQAVVGGGPAVPNPHQQQQHPPAQYRLQYQYGEDPNADPYQHYRPPPPPHENMFTRLSGRIRRPKNGRRRAAEAQFDPRVTTKYDVKALIGKGSFSRVLRVEHKATRYPFAMKVMPAEQGTGPFENELCILSRVDHLHVIRLIEVFRTENRVYVVMELATGGELYDRIISKGRFTEFETALSLRMILDGLSYLHRIGITHRDLKPENILYYHANVDSKLMITDFGLAHQAVVQQTCNAVNNSSTGGCGGDSEQLMTDPCGTPEYIAPEILARIPYTNKVDLWAMGVITFILLSGSMPFDDENRTVLYRHILRCKYHFYPELWCDVSDEARQFVAALLCLDPLRRLSADQSLQNSWLVATVTRALEPITSSHRRPVHKSHSAQDDAGRRRSRSTRSIRSVARSDAGRRVNRAEVERLHQDPEIRRILFEASRNHQLLQQQQQQPASAQSQVQARPGGGSPPPPPPVPAAVVSQPPQPPSSTTATQQAITTNAKHPHPINGVVITATAPPPSNGVGSAASRPVTTTNYGML